MIRAAVAVLLSALVAAAVWWLPRWGFDLIILVTVLGGLREFGRMFLAEDEGCFLAVIAGGAVASSMLFAPQPAEAALLALTAASFVLALVLMHRSDSFAGVAGRLGLLAFGMLYLGVAFPFWSWLRAMPLGRELVLFALAPACLSDAFAFLAGKGFGRHKLSPRVSPNKTVEGFAGALLGSAVGAACIWRLLLPSLSWYLVVAFALLVWIVAPFGDLIESMLKRSAGVKDSGTIIPGHGGVLDRLDALIFTGPAAYVFARYALGM